MLVMKLNKSEILTGPWWRPVIGSNNVGSNNVTSRQLLSVNPQHHLLEH